MLTVQEIISAAVNTPPHTPLWQAAEAICYLRGIPPYAVALNAGPYQGIMNVTAVLAEHMVAASLQLGFRT